MTSTEVNGAAYSVYQRKNRFRLFVKNPSMIDKMPPRVYISSHKTEQAAEEAGEIILSDFKKYGASYPSRFQFVKVARTLAYNVERRYNVVSFATANRVKNEPISVSMNSNKKFVASITSHKIRRKVQQQGSLYFFDEYDTYAEAYDAAKRLISQVRG